MVSGEDVAREAELLVGSRWQRNGRGPLLDCAGLVVCSARNAGLTIEDCPKYDIKSLPGDLAEDFCSRNGVIMPPTVRLPGTVFMMRVNGFPGVSHMGIVSTYDRVIHMDAKRHRVVVESFSWLARRCAMTMRLHGLEG